MTRLYTARAGLAAERSGDTTRVTRLRSDGPIALRETAEAVYLVGAAAGPLGGDDLELDIVVGPGARLNVRSTAAALALPGRGESCLAIRATVGEGGHLDFAPEPTVAAKGCHHRAVADIALGEGATLRWREELILGRHKEVPGRHSSRFDVTIEGVPLLRHELCLHDPDVFATSAVLGDAKAVGSLLLVGTGLPRDPYAADGVSVLPLAGPGVLITVTADDSAELRRRLDRAEAAQVA
ncbi:urease accessory protein UreD [Actinomadura barringtoniae]|uniref:Urease accessory protein UreD n=1 Tax=Actinomadura barringtoniae TaxID=1427535 RepID=A0A939T4Y3_9ACTN|nr:urease accessory protein UreD [Actinomadura barringtoniae]MBO2446452.1 urease accessory protein UreD [Actinomadura barringtoniae]